MILFHEQKNQLCNRLFALIPSVSYALENKERLVVLFFSKKYLSHFPHLNSHPLIHFVMCSNDTYPTGALKLLHGILKGIGKIATINRKNFSFRKLSSNKNRLLFIRGWKERHAPSYTEEHKNTIKYLFEPAKEVKDLVTSVWPDDIATVVVGVHIRRGDYRNYKNGQYYFSDAVYMNYMDALKNLLESEGKKVQFIICSNEPVGNELLSDYDVISLPASSSITDLHALSKCDYIIGPPSTFSQWASFIGDVPLRFIMNENEQISLSDFIIISAVWGN